MSDLFEGFGKIPRLSKGWSVSEKIDGTNAQVYIKHETTAMLADIGEGEAQKCVACRPVNEDISALVFAGSRNRLLTVDKDNFGFAQWVYENADELLKLGPGRHFGEWAGPGIQKNPLDLPEKQLFLFNPRWLDQGPDCVSVVPQLGIHQTGALEYVFWELRMTGTKVQEAGPEAKTPEGIICYHLGSGQLYKRTYEQDGGKWNG